MSGQNSRATKSRLARVAFGLAFAFGLFSLFLWATGTVREGNVTWPIAAVGLLAASSLASAIILSFWRAPSGAAPTQCDASKLLMGLGGVLFATNARSADPVFSNVTGSIVTVASVLLLVWVLRERTRLVRSARARLAGTGMDGDGDVCTSCAPLFAHRDPAGVLSAAPASANGKEPL